MLKHDLSLENVKKAFEYPRQAIDETVYEICYRIPSAYLNTKRTIGTNVFTRDWDLLIILDTCRVDAIKAVASEYEFITDIDSIRSVGGRSPEWIAKTFIHRYRDEIQETGYLSANVFPERILRDKHQETASIRDEQLTYKFLAAIPTVDVNALGHFEYLYQYEPVGESGPLGHEDGGTPPRYVTDRGIAVGRSKNLDRLILHYLQPHPPYVANALKEDRELHRHEHDWWGYLGETGDYETIWETYLDELRYVLDDVEVLLENIDAETVAITADHGEAFGEYWEFGHKTGSLHPKVRTVPWIETTATDGKTYIPSFDPPTESTSNNGLEDQLEALGYQ